MEPALQTLGSCHGSIVELLNYWTDNMPVVTVKKKYQVVIPRAVREKAGIRVGDLLEAKIERGKITFTPKALVDRGILESLSDFRRGTSFGPFPSAADLVKSLRKESKHVQTRKRAAGSE